MYSQEFLNNYGGLTEGTIADEKTNRTLMDKWNPLIDSSWTPWTRRCMARLYENTENQLRAMQYTGPLMEATSASDIPDLVKYLFPKIRRVWSSLLANNLFSVQPMSSPIGGIFFWEYKYGTSKGTITAGDNMIANFDRYYTSEYVDSEAIGDGTNLTGTLSWKPVKGYATGQVGIEFVGTADSDGSTKRIYDGDGTGTLTGDTGAASTLVLATGVYDITFSEAVSGVVANYFFSMEAASDNVPQMRANIILEPIKASSRKLKMLWSKEAQDDMMAVLNDSMDGQLTDGGINEMALEIDREILMTAYGSGTTNTGVFDAAVPPGRTQVDHFRNITTVIEKVSGEIATRTKRGPGNFMIIGPSVQPVFGALATHGDLRVIYDGPIMTPQGQGTQGRPFFQLPQAPNGYGIYPLGTLQSRWLVIVDPHFPSGKIMVGLKGELFADSGVVYAPYRPLEVTQSFYDPADFTIRKGLCTRYAKKVVNADFYGIITVTNLP